MRKTKIQLINSAKVKVLLRSKATRLLAIILAVTLGGVGFAMHRASASPTMYYRSSTVGYTTSPSSFNADGDTVEFHLASLASYNPPQTTMFIVKIGEDELKKVDGESGVYIDNIEYHDCKQSELGCDWPISYKLDVSGWESGLYYAYLVDGRQTTPPGGLIVGKSFYEHFNFVPFIVKDADPHNKILVQLPIDTWAAWDTYNDGAGYYSSPNTTTVSFQRPMKKKFGAIKSDSYMLLKWLADNGYDYDVAGDVDLENYSFLARYKLLIPVGHGEYWTTKMADSLREFRDNGGNIAFMTGNTMYWRSRYNSASQTLETYKLAWLRIDPFYKPKALDYDASKVSTYFQPSLLTNDLRNAGSEKYDNIKIMGIHGDYVSGTGGYKIYHTNDDKVSWLFDGVDISDGEMLADKVGFEEGKSLLNPEVGVAGSVEVDRVEYSFVNGQPVAHPDSGALDNLVILGIGDMTSRRHHDSDKYTRVAGQGAVMAIYNAKPEEYPQWGQGATVFATGSWNWSKKGLDSQLSYYDPRVDRITRNLIDRMSSGSPVSTAPVYRQHRITLQQGVNGYKEFTTRIFSTTDTSNEVLVVRGIGTSAALVRAELPELPEGAIIDSASLSMYGLTEGHPDSTNLIDAVPLSSDVLDMTGLTGNFNLGVFSATGSSIRNKYIYGGRIKIHKTRDGEGGRSWGKDKWHTFDITTSVKHWYSTGEDHIDNNGLLIFNPNNNVRYVFASSYNKDVSKRPKINIIYHTEAPEETSPCENINTVNISSLPTILTVHQGDVASARFVLKNVTDVKRICARSYTVTNGSPNDRWMFSNVSSKEQGSPILDISLDDGASTVVYMTMDTANMTVGLHNTTMIISTQDPVSGGLISRELRIDVNVTQRPVGCQVFDESDVDVPISVDTYLDGWAQSGAVDETPSSRVILLAYPGVRVPLLYADTLAAIPHNRTDAEVVSAKLHIGVSNDHGRSRDYTVRAIKPNSDIANTPWYETPSSLLSIVNVQGISAAEWVNEHTEATNYGILHVSKIGLTDVDITDLVQLWLDDPTTNRGLAIVANDGTGFYQSFHSSEDPSHFSRRPYLSVTYKYCAE